MSYTFSLFISHLNVSTSFLPNNVVSHNPAFKWRNAFSFFTAYLWVTNKFQRQTKYYIIVMNFQTLRNCKILRFWIHSKILFTIEIYCCYIENNHLLPCRRNLASCVLFQQSSQVLVVVFLLLPLFIILYSFLTFLLVFTVFLFSSCEQML